MEKAAKDFLKKSAEKYEVNKNKWKNIVEKKGYEFSEDIFQDSILKTYDAILKKETDTDFMGYWFVTFLNSTKRNTLYKKNKIKTIDIDEIEKNNKMEKKK